MDKSILDIDGWMSEENLQLLYDLVRDAPDDAIIVEIGAWKGRSTSALYTARKPNQWIVSIDTWLGQPDLRYGVHREALDNDLFLEWYLNIHKYGIHPLWYKKDGMRGCSYLRMDSVDAATLFEDGQVYMVFDDGDHTIVDKTLEKWLPKVKQGGVYCGHDWFWNDGVVQPQVRKYFEPDFIIGDIWGKNIKGLSTIND